MLILSPGGLQIHPNAQMLSSFLVFSVFKFPAVCSFYPNNKKT